MTRRQRMAVGAVALLAGLAGIGGLWAWAPDIPRATLEAQYARGEQDFVTVDGMRLHVRDSGPQEAPAVLMLHGFGSSLQTCLRVCPLAAHHIFAVRR